MLRIELYRKENKYVLIKGNKVTNLPQRKTEIICLITAQFTTIHNKKE